MGINNEWEMVKEFHEKFGHGVGSKPSMLTAEQAERRGKWMLEEINEFLEADDITEQADAMLDLIYFALGTLVEMGVKPERPFGIVQKANMSKLWEDGKPRYNPDGKIIKPPAWTDPYLELKASIRQGGC